MSPELVQLGIMIINASLQRAMEVSNRIASGTLSQAYLDSLSSDDDRARADQIAARDRAVAEGR